MELAFLHQLQVIHNPILDAIMVFLSAIGDAGMVWIFLSLFLLLFKKYRRVGAAMLLALLLGFLTANVILKPLVARERPCWLDPSVRLLIPNPKDYSFPSGHTVAGFAAATALFLHHKKAGAAALILALAIAFSRLYLFVHFPSDVLAGIVIGVSMAVLATILIKKQTKGDITWTI